MSPAKNDEAPSPDPQTPRRNSPVKHSHAATPANRRASAQAGATPKSAPAAAGHGSSQKKKPEPTLLTDFLLGRPSPARVAAQREALKQRRKSMAADAANVREELRQEMRAAAVRRLQQPGGVRDRVKAWQKASAAAMKEQGAAVPNAEDAASEPTEIAVQIAPESVTEEDRVRIRMRQKPRKKKPKAENADDKEDKENCNAEVGQDTAREKAAGPAPASPELAPVKDAPKKRIVSDDAWMKRRKGKSPPRAGLPRRKAEGSPTPIPRDFLQRTAQNPSVQNKIRDWAERIEIPEPPKVKAYRHKKSGATVLVEEDAPSVVASDPGGQATSRVQADDGIRVKPMKPRIPKMDPDDGIRITPVRKNEPPDDGIRVRPMDSALPDDGIRVRPIDSPSPDDGIRVRPSPETPLDEVLVRPTPSRPISVERNTRNSSTRRDHTPAPGTRRDGSSDEMEEVVEGAETGTDTPTKKKVSRRRSRRTRSPSPIVRTVHPPANHRSEAEASHGIPRHDDSDDESERIPPTVLGNKPLADIPVGYSAFSVLDLPLGGEARHSAKKPKAQRNPSFKTMPKVLKKVVTGAKEIIQDRAEPPRPTAANKPQSIESWLNDTVDPFVDQPAPQAQTSDRQPTPESPGKAPESQNRPTSQPPSESLQKDVPASAPQKNSKPQETTEQEQEDSDTTPKNAKSPVPPSTGLKRRSATRASPSAAKTGGKRPFRDFLKEAFRGQSGGHKLPPMVYPSCEADYDEQVEYEEHDRTESAYKQPRSVEPGRRPPSPNYSSAYGSTISSDSCSHAPPRNRPPTTGVHELSTIVSEGSCSTAGSETVSTVSQTTVTQTTAFTKSTDISRQRSQKPGLRRRLTKHSDLVSVLSLPDDGQLVAPSRSKSIKSSRSLHRRPSKADKSRINDLLDEFADDEHFYSRELKTLVDGVIPVLLTDVLRGGAVTGNTGGTKADAVAKSVVNMGITLEKLKDFHRRVPLSDIGALLRWLEAVSPVYDNYLDVWRLGFQGLIINLAPNLGRSDDNDSLLNALPRNEDGDVVGENGERVDVAFLLKRPLIRIKWMTKFLRAAVTVMGTPEAEQLLSVFEALQEKARKRHREETARMTDEDANNTDTTRCRDLRNLLPLGGVLITQTRQVSALDVFALDLDHSSGQRLECQVELIHRDTPGNPADKGDILIREIGNDTRSWLLFPPVPTSNISARRDDIDRCLIVMIRGTHNGNEWYELLKLSTSSEEQIIYWLGVLGSNPLPPLSRRRPTSFVPDATSPKQDGADIPLGERRPSVPSLETLEVEKSRGPPQYGRRHGDPLSTPPSPSPDSSFSPSPDRTPTRESYPQAHVEKDRRLPSWDSPSLGPAHTPRPPPNSTPYREDGAPPPPIHRTLGPKSSGLLAPPVDLNPQTRVKRRMSSPLKHEYHPSDISSDSSSSLSDDSESCQSSSDELDDDEVPDTIPGYSIKEPEAPPTESVVSEISITPSNSASQVEPSGQGGTKPGQTPQRYTASVSYWSSRKGIWRDINHGEPASVVVHPGSMEVHDIGGQQHPNRQAYPLQSSGTSEIDNTNKDAGSILPLIALVLTPVVMIRRSTALDLEVRSPASPESRLKVDCGMFRFRASNQAEAKDLYEAVHLSRLNNARYIQLSEEARFRSFGQTQPMPGDGSVDDDSSSRRRSWFGRKNSYRASTRAPSVSQGSVSTAISASSFLRRLVGGANNAFNIDESTVDKQWRPGSAALGGGSLYTSSASSSGGGGTSTPPRSLSASLAGSGSRWSNGLAKAFSPENPLEIRCHLNVQNNRWLDKGDCVLHITQPPPGVRQELSLYHGLEKRIIVKHVTKKSGGDKDKPLILLDAVLGSKCFSMLGTKGVMCSVWENLRDEQGNVGVPPRNGAVAGKVTKWCFQCKSVQQANWIMQMVTAEVPGLMTG